MSKLTTRIAAEQVEGGCEYNVQSDWEKLPIVLSDPTLIETIDERKDTELTTLKDLVGSRFITRGHESLTFDDGTDAVEYPLISESFQIINNFVGTLPETSLLDYQTPKKNRVFASGGYKVLAVRGIRPISRDAPGVNRGGNTLADMLDKYDLQLDDWERLYETSLTRFSVQMTGIRAGVVEEDIHTDRHVYGVRIRDEETAYHVSGVFNSLIYTLLQIEWFGRIRFTSNDVVSNLQLKSLKKAPIPDVDERLSQLQQEIEALYQGDLPLDERIEQITELQTEREHRICELYGLLDEQETPVNGFLEEAKTWEHFMRRILNLTEDDIETEKTTLRQF